MRRGDGRGRRSARVGAFAFLVLLVAASGAGAKEEERMLEAVFEGTSWYEVRAGEGEGEGEAVGYARLDASRPREGGLALDWTLKLDHGGPYEETRRLVFDASGRLVESVYRAFDNLVCAGRRDGERFLVTTLREGKPVEEAVALPPDDAVTGMAFPLAAAVGPDEGDALVFTELDEANGLVVLGRVRYVREAKDRVRVARAKGGDRVVTLGEGGRIAAVDWGGGIRTVRAETSTEHLYVEREPVFAVVEEGERLVLEGTLAGFAPEEVYDHFTKPALLATFWAPEAEVEPEVGGRYHLSWPGPGWTLEGKVLEARRPGLLAFTWRWKHRPEAKAQRVDLAFSPAEDAGTRVRVVHGPYADGPDAAAERSGHVQGWETAFSRLRALR